MSGPPQAEPAPQSPRARGRVLISDLSGFSAGSDVPLSREDARHLIGSRRLETGDPIELFDPAGLVCRGTLNADEPASIRLETAPLASQGRFVRLTVASAVPKGARVDWLVEKLAELDVVCWIPLRTRRSVVDPRDNKLDRLARVAREAAKQCGRADAMAIDPVTDLSKALQSRSDAFQGVLTTEKAGRPLRAMAEALRGDVTLFIGPEGGWEPGELDAFEAAGVVPVRLGATILRLETAAVAAAAIVTASGVPEVAGGQADG